MASTAVLLTEFCNMRCGYCLAKDKIRQGVSDIKRADRFWQVNLPEIEVIMEYLKKDTQRDFRILGGEPTLHSHFDKVIRTVLSNGFNIDLFTNGIFKESLADFLVLIPKERITYVFNVNTRRHYSGKQWRLINGNLSLLKKKKVILSFNIDEINFDYSFIIDLARQFKIRELSVSVAMPGSNKAADCVHPVDYKRLIPRIREFASACNQYDICWGWNCCLPRCVFKKDELDDFISLVACHIPSTCITGLTIGPRLETSMCLGTSGFPAVTLTDFTALREIREYFSKKYMPFRRVGGYDKCLNCMYIKRGKCQGGCIGYTMNTFRKTSDAYEQ